MAHAHIPKTPVPTGRQLYKKFKELKKHFLAAHHTENLSKNLNIPHHLAASLVAKYGRM
jgi:hypothetical protein